MSDERRSKEASTQRWVTLGFISGVHGVRGRVKVHSWTRPREAILEYGPWCLGPSKDEYQVRSGGVIGKALTAALEKVDERETAQGLIKQEITVPRSRLPDAGPNEYYWADLVGLEVFTCEGDPLGTVKQLIDTGAHDVLVITGERERLVPFVQGRYIRHVDLEAGRIEADWDPNWDKES